MPVSNAISAFGTKLQIGNGATPETFVDIAEVRDISGPALSADTADVTHHGSVGGYEEVIPTILRTGEITFALNFLPTETTHSYGAGLLKDYEAKTKRNFRLVFPNIGATTWSFAAYVTGFTPGEPVAGQLAADVTLKLTGKPTLA